MTEKPWYRDGLSFGCTQCGRCCRSHGEYSFLYVMEAEIEALAAALGLETEDFRARFCRLEEGWWVVRADDPDCPFLDPQGRCSVYEARPVQCRSWPFWSDNLRREVWEGPVRETCPGIGSGRTYSPEEAEAIARANDEWYQGAGDEEGADPASALESGLRARPSAGDDGPGPDTAVGEAMPGGDPGQ